MGTRKKGASVVIQLATILTIITVPLLGGRINSKKRPHKQIPYQIPIDTIRHGSGRSELAYSPLKYTANQADNPNINSKVPQNVAV